MLVSVRSVWAGIVEYSKAGRACLQRVIACKKLHFQALEACRISEQILIFNIGRATEQGLLNETLVMISKCNFPGLLKPVGFVLILAITAVGTVNAAETESEHGHPKNAIALFMGATHAHGENEPTLGLEFGTNLNETWSIGGVIERSDRGKETTLLLAGVGWHPRQKMRLQLAVGRKDPSDSRENVLRTAMTYEYELAHHWFIKPYLAYDFIEHEEDEPVFGLYIGKLF